MMSAVDILCYVVFVANLTIATRGILRTLLSAKEIVSTAQAELRTPMPRSTVLESVITTLSYVFAFLYADLAPLWLLLSILSFTTGTLMYAIRAALSSPHPALTHMLEYVQERRVAKGLVDPPIGTPKQRAAGLRRWTIAEIMVSVLWVYSWRQLLGFG